VGSLEKRIQHLEEATGVESDGLYEEARRRRAQEVLTELESKLAKIAERAALEEAEGESGRWHAFEYLEDHMERRGTVRALYREVFGYEIGDEEYQRREALRKKYGAVSLAPRSEQQKLRRL
jgi:hypothetical protein